MENVRAGVPQICLLYPQVRTGRVVMTDGSTRLLRETDAFDGGDILPGLGVPLSRLSLPVKRTFGEVPANDDG